MAWITDGINRVFSNGTPLHDPIAKPQGETQVKSTTCYMCACRCGIHVHVRDGEARFIEHMLAHSPS